MDIADFQTLKLSRKALKVAHDRGWSETKVFDTFLSPKAVYPVKGDKYTGQFRIAGTKIVIVGVPRDAGVFLGITLFANGSKTPHQGR